MVIIATKVMNVYQSSASPIIANLSLKTSDIAMSIKNVNQVFVINIYANDLLTLTSSITQY